MGYFKSLGHCPLSPAFSKNHLPQLTIQNNWLHCQWNCQTNFALTLSALRVLWGQVRVRFTSLSIKKEADLSTEKNSNLVPGR